MTELAELGRRILLTVTTAPDVGEGSGTQTPEWVPEKTSLGYGPRNGLELRPPIGYLCVLCLLCS